MRNPPMRQAPEAAQHRVELRRRITSAKRTTAIDIPSNQRTALGDNSNVLFYVGMHKCQPFETALLGH